MSSGSSKEDSHHVSTLIEIDGSGRNYAADIENFKLARGVHFVLAISGGADSNGSNKAEKVISGIIGRLRNYPIAIQTGGTKGGIPELAIDIARQHMKPTIGVYPLAAAEKWALPGKLDLAICVHPLLGTSQWGDESAIFTKVLDSVVVVGGNAGTLIEVSHLLKMNEKKASKLAEIEQLEEQDQTGETAALIERKRIEASQLKLRHIIPVYGTGGVADTLPFFQGKPDTMRFCMPHQRIITDKQVYNYLVKADVLSEDDF